MYFTTFLDNRAVEALLWLWSSLFHEQLTSLTLHRVRQSPRYHFRENRRLYSASKSPHYGTIFLIYLQQCNKQAPQRQTKRNEKVLIFRGWSVFISFISFQRGVCFRSLYLNQEKLCRYGSTGELRLFNQVSSVWLSIILQRCWLTEQTLKRRKWKSCTQATLMHLFKFIKINIPANSLIQDRSNSQLSGI